MENSIINYSLNRPESVADALSQQLLPKDGMLHTIAFSFNANRLGVIEPAFAYLQAQGREIVDFKPAGMATVMVMTILYK